MSITSFYFLCLFALALLLYYLVPKKMQWPLLLLLSIGYFLTSAEVRDSHAWYLILYDGSCRSCLGCSYFDRQDKRAEEKTGCS